ncbi:putative transcription factor interactor and regulator CCHC(Zn) family [Helianthus anomalus]
MMFVSGASSEEEMKSSFWKQINREFLDKKTQEEMKNEVVQKKETRTCFQCNTTGHLAKDCSKAIHAKQGVSWKLKEKMVEKEPPPNRLLFSKTQSLRLEKFQRDFKKEEQNLTTRNRLLRNLELSSGDESDSTKSEEPQISNQFFSEKKEFDVEKAFNPKVKHIFEKMINRKVKGVKEFYEKKTGGKKPIDGNPESPKAGQALVDIFFD